MEISIKYSIENPLGISMENGPLELCLSIRPFVYALLSVCLAAFPPWLYLSTCQGESLSSGPNPWQLCRTIGPLTLHSQEIRGVCGQPWGAVDQISIFFSLEGCQLKD